MKNAIVGQSGGPTSVINSSLAGVYESARLNGIETVYGMCHGVVGLLKDELIDLKDYLDSSLKVDLLKRTPSSYLGSCRYKLKDYNVDDSEYKTIFANLEKHDIGYFFYIGGNDSMDTIGKLAAYGAKIHSPIRFVGVPKTIDNDLAITDHCPGYGSAAKYVATIMKEIGRDAMCYGTPVVTIVEIMGRNAGWLTAAAALSRSADFAGVDIICLPEVPFEMDKFIEKVKEVAATKASVLIAISEGVALADGRYVCELGDGGARVDAFGHKNMTGTCRYLAGIIEKEVGVRARPIELSLLQRCAGHLTSGNDINEAYQCGGTAVNAAIKGESGVTVIMKRVSSAPYCIEFDLAPTSALANFEKKIPLEWISEDGIGLLQPFYDYANPLIQNEFNPLYVNGLPHHLVANNEVK
ncbi:MAG: 6-phosphofructokinase [Bacilli bacterium]|nr:6-phosphofructokinase [Bacilli bacterium]